MLFSSYIFLFVFLPVTLAGFCLLSRGLGPKPAKVWLTLSSLVFYGWWNPRYVLLILASMLFNYWLGRRIGQAVRSGRAGVRRGRTGWGSSVNRFYSARWMHTRRSSCNTRASGRKSVLCASVITMNRSGPAICTTVATPSNFPERYHDLTDAGNAREFIANPQVRIV